MMAQGVQKGGIPAHVMHWAFASFLSASGPVLPPHTHTSSLLRCRQGLPAFRVSQPWAACLCLPFSPAQWLTQLCHFFSSDLGRGSRGKEEKEGEEGEVAVSVAVLVCAHKASEGWKWCLRKEYS